MGSRGEIRSFGEMEMNFVQAWTSPGRYAVSDPSNAAEVERRVFGSFNALGRHSDV